MVKNQQVKSALLFRKEYEYTLFSDKIYEVNADIDIKLSQYLSKVSKASVKLDNTFQSYNDRVICANKMVKETLNQLNTNIYKCATIYLEKQLFMTKYKEHLKTEGFVELKEPAMGDFKFTLSIKDLCSYELKSDYNTKIFELVQNFNKVPFKYKKEEQYLPSIEDMSLLYFGILLHRIPLKTTISFDKVVKEVKHLIEEPDMYEDITQGFVEISAEGFEKVYYQSDIEEEKVGSHSIIKSIKSGKAEGDTYYPVYEFEYDKQKLEVLSISSMISILNDINSDEDYELKSSKY